MSRIYLMSVILIVSGFSSAAVAQPDRTAAMTRQCLADTSRATSSLAAYRNGGARQRAALRNHVSAAQVKARRACHTVARS